MPDSKEIKIDDYEQFSGGMIEELCSARSLLVGVEKIVEQEIETNEISSAIRLLRMLKGRIDSVLLALDKGPEEYLAHVAASAKSTAC